MTTSFERPLPLPGALRALRCWEFPGKLGLFDRIFGRALSRHGIVWVRTAPGPVWRLDLANPTHQWIVYGCYEGTALWRWLVPRRDRTSIIFDSGANIGQTALYFASLLPAARIFSYEPGSEARAWLTECVTANGLRQITIAASGLGATAQSARLATENGAAHHGSWNKVSSTEGEPISLVTFDDELARLGLASVDFWKLDMEGYELEALRGAARALQARRVRALHVEIGSAAGEPALAYLHEHGYTAHRITPRGRLAPWRAGLDYENALCLAPGEAPSP